MFERPTFILNPSICKRNIESMAVKFNGLGLTFRPHFKTHQSAEVGEWFRQVGVHKITVSSVKMAAYFAEHGWDDILIAFPANIRELDQINQLAETIQLHLTLESSITALILAESMQHKTGVYIEIDEGYHRTGISFEKKDTIEEILDIIDTSKNLALNGFLAHFGQTYSALGPEEVKAIFEESMKKLWDLRNYFTATHPDLILSVGDTPSCSILEDFPGVNEIRPGNFVFYDIMQQHIGSCKTTDIASIVVCPVVAKYPVRNEIAIYGGAVHLSKEYIAIPGGKKIYGWVVPVSKEGWGEPFPDTYVSRLSQEHGIIQTKNEIMEKIQPGDVIGILPVHSCLTANLYDQYFTMDGKLITKMRS